MVKFRLALVQDAQSLKYLNDLFNGENCNSIERIRESLDHNTQEIVCVAEDEGVLLGFCCGQVFKSMCYEVNYGEITELFILDDYRRKGVGKGLMAFLEGEFQKHDIRSYQLFTGRDNDIAKRFYQSCGYSEDTEVMFRKRL